MKERLKDEDVRKGRGVDGIIEDTDKGIREFGTENTKLPYDQLNTKNSRLHDRLSRSRGRSKRKRR